MDPESHSLRADSPKSPDSTPNSKRQGQESGTTSPRAGSTHNHTRDTHNAQNTQGAPGNNPNSGCEDGNVYDDKRQGKELYEKGDIDGAIEKWSKSIRSLSFILNKSRSPDEGVALKSLEEYTSLYVSLSLNLSLAYLKKEDYPKCKEYCQYVLMYDPQSLKAHLRIVQADIMLKNYEQALSNCKKGIKLNPRDAELKRLKATILEKISEHQKKERALFKNVFDKLDPDPRTAEDMLEEFTRTRMYKFSNALFMFYYYVWQVMKRAWRVFKVSVLFTKETLDSSFLCVERGVSSVHAAVSRFYHSFRRKRKS